MSEIPVKPSTRQLQMDGLRAIAVIFVLIHHFGSLELRVFNFGTIGVRFFFVVSGFLITRILLRSREKTENGKSTWRTEMGNFHLRRLIRTLPAYYLSLFIAVALAIPPVRETIAWTLSFLTNFYMARLGDFPATISHFWTLAVQEQFYFAWPWLIFFLPKPWVRFSFPALILASLAFRYWCIASGASDITRWFNVLGNLDSFAAGGLLAYISQTKPTLIENKSTRLWSGGLALVCMIVAQRLRLLPTANPWSIFTETLECIAMGWLIACSVSGFRGLAGRFFSWRPLVYLGQISYGIYVYHVLVAILLLPLFVHFGYEKSIYLRFFAQSFISIGVASLSWHFFEQPLLEAREKIDNWLTTRKASATCTSDSRE